MHQKLKESENVCECVCGGPTCSSEPTQSQEDDEEDGEDMSE